MAERHDTDCHVIATEAPWQTGMCERHGAVLASIIDASVEQLNVVGYEEMSQAMTAATVAKNRRPDRTGFSARSRVFGADETLPASVIP